MLQLKLCDEFLKIKHHFFLAFPTDIVFWWFITFLKCFLHSMHILMFAEFLFQWKSFAQTLQLGHHDISPLFSKVFLTFSECSPIWWLLNLILSYFHMHSNSGFVIFDHFYCTWCLMNFFLRKKYFFASTATSCFSLYSWLKIICYISCMIWHLMSYKILKLKNRF